jgi:nicotinamide phosphoribosyltransferase
MSISNIIAACDGYKVDHRSQYPVGTNLVYSNWTCRKSRIPGVNKFVFFGLQYLIKRYLQKEFNDEFFNKPKEEVVAKYKRRIENYLGKGAITYDHIEALHDLGYLPIEIKALPEGVSVPVGVPMFTIRNTINKFFWVTNMLETLISCTIWQAIVSATLAKQFRIKLDKWADKTSDMPMLVDWQGHDFAYRGCSSMETASISGGGHLLSFIGTDTIPAIQWLEDYYNADCETELIGGSVPATEHSVVSLGGSTNEFETFKRLITEVYPKGIVSLVSDTWNLWQIVQEFLPRLKNEIMNRDGKVVIRPDSGDPVQIICGGTGNLTNKVEEKYRETALAGLIAGLHKTFGGTKNSKGYIQLDPHIGAIYGDAINLDRCEQICSNLANAGFASTNMVYGIGSFTYQYNTRDTIGGAMKATYGEVNGEPRNIFKDPVTDDGEKKSLCGIINVYKDENGEYFAKDRQTVQEGEFLTVFKNGKLLIDHDLKHIRQRVRA